MNAKFRYSKSRTFYRSTHLVIPLILLFSAAISGCKQDNVKALEAKIVELENQNHAQTRQIEYLAGAATLGKASVFDTSLQQFFNSPEFWEVVYEDKGVCHAQCHLAFRQAIAACNGDKTCESTAAAEHIACRIDCGLSY